MLVKGLNFLKMLLKGTDDFLKFPKLQYIPLTINNLSEGANENPHFDNTQPRFFLFQDREQFTDMLSQLGLAHIEISTEELNNHVLIIALNFKVKRGYFRHLKTKFIGTNIYNYFQIFYITKKYFPKRVLHFILYTEEGEKITWQNFEIV